MITHGNDSLKIDQCENAGEEPKGIPIHWLTGGFNEMAAWVRVNANQSGGSHYLVYQEGRRWLIWRAAKPLLPTIVQSVLP